mgnify:CR=1 FL=1
MKYDPHDPYFRRAKVEGYLARSVYKLIELDKRYRLFRRGMRVLELGAAPGSWTQYLVQRYGPDITVWAFDTQPLLYAAPQVTFYQLDVCSPEIEAYVGGRQWDAVLSDMAPATSGNRVTDQARSVALVERSLQLAENALGSGGIWVAKLLEGPEREVLVGKARRLFAEVFVFRPASTRKGSTECFLVGRKRR